MEGSITGVKRIQARYEIGHHTLIFQLRG